MNSRQRLRTAGIIALLLLAVLAYPAWLWFSSLRAGTRQDHSKANLKAIGVALHADYDQWGKFPPAYQPGPDGTPWHSWRGRRLHSAKLLRISKQTQNPKLEAPILNPSFVPHV